MYGRDKSPAFARSWLQVPDAEFFAVEQALLAAGRQLAARSASHAASGANTRKIPVSLSAQKTVDAVTQHSSPENKKRKLPPSFAQAKQQAPAAPAALHYKVSKGQTSHCTLQLEYAYFLAPQLFTSSQILIHDQAPA